VAVGNVVGSNIANAGLILGLAALVRPLRVQVKLLRVDAPIALAVSLLLAAFLGNGRLGRGEGAVLVAGLAVYVWWAFRGARAAAAEGATVEVRGIARGRAAQGLAFALGLALLVAGSHAFLVGAERAARAFGVSQAVIGLTIVAVGTSLPELATSTVAAWRRQGDVAVGNVVGSNIFNVLGILGVAALVSPLQVEGIEARDLGMMIVMALALLPLLRTGLRIGRREGALLLGAWLVYTISLCGS
jgi:cation:H+ antiporter